VDDVIMISIIVSIIILGRDWRGTYSNISSMIITASFLSAIDD